MAVAPTAGICEDDDELRGVLRGALEREGFDGPGHAPRAPRPCAAFGDDPPDVLVLDIGLPDADGRDVCQALRARGINTPVLFLTARDAVPDRISGFHAGGDDYLTKPFALAELLVRVRSLLRRTPAAEPTAAGVVLDPTAHALVQDGTRIALTPTEFRLLAALAASPGTVLRRARSSPPAGPTARSCTTTRSTPISHGSAASCAPPARRTRSRPCVASAT